MKHYPRYKSSGRTEIGSIPFHWSCERVKFQCYEVFPGATPSTSKPEFWDGEIPWIPSGCCHDCLIYEAPKFITELGLKNSSTKIVPANTALIALTGATCANTGFLTFASCTNQSVVAFVDDKKKIYSKYLFYALRNAREELLTFQSGGAQGGINLHHCRNVYIPIPPLAEQTVISDYLDNRCSEIDLIIEKQRRRIELLEELKQSIITNAVTKGLDLNVTLLSSGIDWIGEIPEHWITTPLKFTGKFGNGLTFSPNDVREDGILVLRSQNIQNSKLDFEDCLFVENCPDKLMVTPGDIIICSRNGSVNLIGKCALIEEPINATFGAFMMRYQPSINSKFAFFLFQTTYKKYRGLFATTTINQLTADSISQMYVPLPPKEEQADIADYLDKETSKIDAQIQRINREIELLEEYKQSIITEVVTGKRCVCDFAESPIVYEPSEPQYNIAAEP